MQINTLKKKKKNLLALTSCSAGHRGSLGGWEWNSQPLVLFLLKKYSKFYHQDWLRANTKKSKISVKP